MFLFLGYPLQFGSDTETMTLSAKRKRQPSNYDFGISDSPVSKRYRYAGRIHGRRPLDRMLRGGVCLPERCQSSDTSTLLKLKQAEKTEDDVKENMNRSF